MFLNDDDDDHHEWWLKITQCFEDLKIGAFSQARGSEICWESSYSDVESWGSGFKHVPHMAHMLLVKCDHVVIKKTTSHRVFL